MEPLTLSESVDLADRLAHDLLSMGRQNRIPPRDLIMSLAMAQKFIQKALYQGDDAEVMSAIREAEATFKAVSITWGPSQHATS